MRPNSATPSKDKTSGPLTRSRSTGKINSRGLVIKKTQTKSIHSSLNSSDKREVTRRSKPTLPGPSKSLSSSVPKRTNGSESTKAPSKIAPGRSAASRSHQSSDSSSALRPGDKDERPTNLESQVRPESEHISGSFHTDRTCTSCTSKDKENSLLVKRFGEIKQKCAREESLVNELISTNNRNTKLICSLEAKNMALSAKLDALGKLLPQSRKATRTRANSDILSTEKEKRICQLSQPELMTDTRSLPEEFIPLILSVRTEVHNSVFNEMTESIRILNESGDLLRSRNWRYKYEKVPSDNTIQHGNPPLELAENSDTKGIPKCPLTVATNGSFFAPSGKYPHAMIHDACKNVVSVKEAYAKYRSSSNWNRLTSIIDRDQVTSALYQKTLHSKLSNHKRTCKVLFFKSLGYDKLFTTSKTDQVNRTHQKSEAWTKLLQGISGEDKTKLKCSSSILEESCLRSVDCSYWRTAEWQDIKSSSLDSNEPTFDHININNTVDLLFQNNVARQSFVSLIGYIPVGVESLLTFGKADAWFTTCILMMNLPDGKGGKRNNMFPEVFSVLFPVAVHNILGGIRSMVLSSFPSEFQIISKDSFSPSPDNTDWFEHSFKTRDREATNVVLMPSKSKYYLYVTKEWFTNNICTWIPIVDSYIGQATANELFFEKLEVPSSDENQILLDHHEDNNIKVSLYEYEDLQENSEANLTEELAPSQVPPLVLSKKANASSTDSAKKRGIVDEVKRSDKRIKTATKTSIIRSNIEHIEEKLLGTEVDDELDNERDDNGRDMYLQEGNAFDDLIHDSQEYEEVQDYE